MVKRKIWFFLGVVASRHFRSGSPKNKILKYAANGQFFKDKVRKGGKKNKEDKRELKGGIYH
jgi:hypothetical protein